MPLFYVQPHIIHFCLELFVKALIFYVRPEFCAKKNSHNTMKNMRENKDVSPTFSRILESGNLSELVLEYQRTVDTRFGETVTYFDRDDMDIMMQLVEEMYTEMREKTGLH